MSDIPGNEVTATWGTIDGALSNQVDLMEAIGTGGGGGMIQHGNEWHTPDFAEAGSGGGSGNIDGGFPDSNYGGITPIDGGVP